MPAANPLLHATVPGTGTGYVSESAQDEYGSQARAADLMPAQLAVLLVGAAAGLYVLNKLGFRFVFEASKLGK